MKKVTLGFGRMNPVTSGHEIVANKIVAEAKKRGAEARLYLSHTTNPKKDPLSYEDKIKFVSAAFGRKVNVIKTPARTIIEVAKELEKEGFTEMTLIVGADRVQEFKRLLTRYNGKDFNFDKIEVINAGERDPDADDVTGMSASKMRKLASDGDFDAFSKGAPSNLNKTMVKQMYDRVRKNMKITEQFNEACWPGYTQKGMKKKGDRMVPNCVPEEKTDEAVLDYAQRRKRAQRLRRMQKRLQRMRALQAKRIADPKRLRKRARRSAYKFIRKRLGAGKDYGKLGTSQKIAVDKRLQKFVPAITKISARLLPSVRRRELLRKRSQQMKSQATEQVQTTNDVFEQFLKEKGPSRYYTGLSQSTKEKRAAHFKKMGPKSDSDQKAYADAPGDKEAREKGVPESQYTKKYKQMYGEEVSKKEMQRLDSLVRMGLADKKFLQVIKRSVSKLESGEMLNPQERKAAFDLLQTLLDMTLSTDQLFSMTRRQLQKEENLSELAYEGNIGIMEMMKFFQKASPQQIMEMKKLVSEKKTAQALKLLQSVTGVKLKEERLSFKELIENAPAERILSENDYEELDGLEMAQIEVANLIQDAQTLLGLLDQMEEEPEAWVLSKITRAVDYVESVTDYLEFEDNFEYDYEDGEEEDEDEYDDEMEYEIEELILDMVNEGELELDEEFKELFEEIEGLRKKADKSGIPYGILKQVYNRGMAAWQGGHRPGTTPQQWAFARVNSFITGGKTRTTADADLWAKAKKNEEFSQFIEAQEIGTDAMRIAYARMTPGQNVDLVTAKYTDKVLNVLNDIRTQRAMKLFDEEKDVVKEAIDMHLDKKIPFVENVFRVGSQNYFEFFRQARELHEAGKIELSGEDKHLIEETDIGKFGTYEGNPVPLDCPMYEEETLNEAEYQGQDVELNQPKRGGKKKFYVYVKNDKGNVVKVQWGDTSGLSVKMNDPEARKSFAARHRCDMQKDRTSAAYWACNTPRYAKQLGLSGGGSFFW